MIRGEWEPLVYLCGQQSPGQSDELVEAAAIQADDDPGIGKEIIWTFK